MPNHFHILIRQNTDLSLTKIISKICTSYSKYFNKKYDRVGALFQDQFKSEHVAKNEYLLWLSAYIHLNPIKLIDKDWKEKGIRNRKKALDYLAYYQYSSYLDYIGKDRIQNKILNRKAFPNYFPTQKEFSEEIFEWINFKND